VQPATQVVQRLEETEAEAAAEGIAQDESMKDVQAHAGIEPVPDHVSSPTA
jgi:hypothetical protein